MKEYKKKEVEKLFQAYKLEYNRLEERNAFLEEENQKLAQKIVDLKSKNKELNDWLSPFLKLKETKNHIIEFIIKHKNKII